MQIGDPPGGSELDSACLQLASDSMKRTLSKEFVQDWTLLGLKPMHRALLRRCVENHIAKTSELQNKRMITWHVLHWDALSEHKLLSQFHRTGVLIVDRNGLLRRAIEDRQLDPVLAALQCRSKAQIRLLWNWSLQGFADLHWCTELSFDGVIHDSVSLEGWLRCCLRLGVATECQLNCLLRDIQLPILAKPNTTSSYTDR